MATTVNQAFAEFIDNLTISKSKRDIANSSVDAIKNQIDNLSNKELIPNTVNSKHYVFGSFSRRTKNVPLDDIDVIICFDSCECAKMFEYSWDNIKIVIQNGGNKRLIDLCDKKSTYGYPYQSECELNSNRFKNKLVSSLSSVQYYKNAELHARGEAVTLSLSSYDWTFDLVPAFYYDKDGETIYLIPNGKGRWKKTNPRKERQRIADLNILFKNIVGKVVRLVKYWNKRGKMPTMTSYVLETMVLDFFDARPIPKETDTLFIDLLFKDVLDYIAKNINGYIGDSKGIEGDINTLSYSERHSIMNRAMNDYKKAVNAVAAEVKENNQKKSINIWRDIFGEEFPSYE